MTAALLERLVVPVASPEDAEATARAIAAHLDSPDSLTVVYVVEKAGGGIDKASVEQREEHGEAAFDAFEAGLPDVPFDTATVYARDVTTGILEAARDANATAIVFTTRGGSRFYDLLAGNVSETLLRESHLPVVALPDLAEGGDS